VEFKQKENEMRRPSKEDLIIVLLLACSLCACYTTPQQENDRPAGYYPNPFSPFPEVSFAIEKRQFITIKMYDMSGKEIATLLQDTLDIGTYEAKPDTSVPNGVYLIKFETQDTTYQMMLRVMK
jgi:hypothetical protein